MSSFPFFPCPTGWRAHCNFRMPVTRAKTVRTSPIPPCPTLAQTVTRTTPRATSTGAGQNPYCCCHIPLQCFFRMRLIALGSSFAAGPGIAPQVDAAAGRSGNNYPHLLARRLGLDSSHSTQLLDLTVSGATMLNLISDDQDTGDKVFPPQISLLPPADDDDQTIITVTGGGNDMFYIGSMFARTLSMTLWGRIYSYLFMTQDQKQGGRQRKRTHRPARTGELRACHRIETTLGLGRLHPQLLPRRRLPSQPRRHESSRRPHLRYPPKIAHKSIIPVPACHHRNHSSKRYAKQYHHDESQKKNREEVGGKLKEISNGESRSRQKRVRLGGVRTHEPEGRGKDTPQHLWVSASGACVLRQKMLPLPPLPKALCRKPTLHTILMYLEREKVRQKESMCIDGASDAGDAIQE
ncbi:hypothetical protein L1887_58574 [Cichorium endivia]|nr:hypothetical protein L1887_58574 [Cichorium endivia]